MEHKGTYANMFHIGTLSVSKAGADQGLRIATTQSPLCAVCVRDLDVISS